MFGHSSKITLGEAFSHNPDCWCKACRRWFQQTSFYLWPVNTRPRDCQCGHTCARCRKWDSMYNSLITIENAEQGILLTRREEPPEKSISSYVRAMLSTPVTDTTESGDYPLGQWVRKHGAAAQAEASTSKSNSNSAVCKICAGRFEVPFTPQSPGMTEKDWEQHIARNHDLCGKCQEEYGYCHAQK